MSKAEIKDGRGKMSEGERRQNKRDVDFLTKEGEIWRDWKTWEYLGYVKNNDNAYPQSR